MISIANGESTTKYVNQGSKLKIATTFDGDVHFRKFGYRWKALNLSFRSVVESPKMDITIKSYGDFESDARNQKCKFQQIPETLISKSAKVAY